MAGPTENISKYWKFLSIPYIQSEALIDNSGKEFDGKYLLYRPFNEIIFGKRGTTGQKYASKITSNMVKASVRSFSPSKAARPDIIYSPLLQN